MIDVSIVSVFNRKFILTLFLSWPGILCPDPFKGKYVTYDQDGTVEKYYVEFLGDPHSTAWMSAAFVGHFSLTLEVGEAPLQLMLPLVSSIYCPFLSQILKHLHLYKIMHNMLLN